MKNNQNSRVEIAKMEKRIGKLENKIIQHREAFEMGYKLGFKHSEEKKDLRKSLPLVDLFVLPTSKDRAENKTKETIQEIIEFLEEKK